MKSKFEKFTLEKPRAFTAALMTLVIVFAAIASTGCGKANPPTAATVLTTIENNASAVLNLAASLSNLVGSPGMATVFNDINTAVTTDIPIINAAAAVYKANPNASTWQKVQAATSALESKISVQVLQANKISNPNSDRIALGIIAGVSALVLGMSISASSVNARLHLTSQDKTLIAFVRKQPNGDRKLIEVAALYGYTPEQFGLPL